VNGELLQNRFDWKSTVHPIAERPGHFNDVWSYWTTDGLGFYELLLLCELIGAEPVYVMFNGVAQQSSIPTNDAQKWVQDGLDSLEFAMGDANTTWGAVRVQMGHPEPFIINRVSIGNEDSTKPFYTGNYLLFWEALTLRYPHMILIANADMGSSAPTYMYDYHVYQYEPAWFVQNQYLFDTYDRSTSPLIFNSEYATVTADYAGDGNLNASVGESCWMIGLERNSDLVMMGSYAPLLVNANDRNWNPDAIVIDSNGVYGTPSYWNQYLFSNHAGVTLLDTELIGLNSAFSATCADKECLTLYFKVTNYTPSRHILELALVNAGNLAMEEKGTVSTITGQPLDENSFDNPLLVAPVTSPVYGLSNNCSLLLQPWSTNVFTVTLTDQKYSKSRR